MQKAVIIGGGLGGISAAITLKQIGLDVELYEKNSHVGGKLNIKQKDGFTFDLGPSILTMPHIFEKLFSGFGKNMADYVQIIQLDHEWRSFFEDKTFIDLHNDINKMIENRELTDEDIQDLKKYHEYSKKIYLLTEKGYFNQGLDTFRETIKYYGIKSLLDFDYISTMNDKVVKHVRNRKLQDILNFFIKYVGSSPYNAPAVLNLLFYVQNRFGLWYVSGGMFNLSKALTTLAAEEGIKMVTGSRVIAVEKEGRRIRAAVLENGDSITADLFVSNMEVIPFYEHLSKEQGAFFKTLKKFEPACSGYVLHLGVKKQYPLLAHHNFFFSADPEKHFDTIFNKKQLPEDPTIYLVNTNKTDPSQCPEGCENIKILPHIPYIQHEGFTESAYEAFENRILNKLENMGLDGLRENTVVRDVWRPEDIRRNYLSNRGAIYGVVSDRKLNSGLKAPKKSTLYDNLYFVGGSVNPGGGMPMAVLSGQNLAKYF